MKKLLALSLLAATVFATAAQADVVYDNVTVNPVYGYSSGTSVGLSIVTGGTTLRLTDFLIPQLSGTSPNYVNAYTAGESFALYANNQATNMPVTAISLASFTVQNVSTGSTIGQTTATPTTPTILTANTRYWLVLNAPSAADTVNWNYAAYDTANPNYYKFNSSLGVTLPATNTSFEAPGGVATYFDYTDGPQMIYLEAVAVPEPSTYAMFLVGGVGAFLLVRRFRAARVA